MSRKSLDDAAETMKVTVDTKNRSGPRLTSLQLRAKTQTD